MTESHQRQATVSVCIPTCNSVSTLKRTLQSVAAQDYPCLTVLISDDCSDDATPAVCSGFIAQRPGWSLHRQSHRVGWVRNVNSLLRRVETDYFCVLPHDDVLLPGYVDRLVQSLQDNPRAVLAFDCPRVVPPGNPDGSASIRIADYSALDGVTGRIQRARAASRYQVDVLNGRYPDVLTIAYRGLIRHRLASRLRGMRRNFSGDFGADWAWLFKLAMLGEFIHVRETLSEKHRSRNSLASSWQYSYRQRVGEWSGCFSVLQGLGLSPVERIRVITYLLEAGMLGSLLHIRKVLAGAGLWPGKRRS